MHSSTTPLQAINQKELELRRRVHEARAQAQGRVQAARDKAEQMTARAKQEGGREAENCYQREIEQARRQAEEILEEGLPMETLWRVVQSMHQAAPQAGVHVVTGDTEVVDKEKETGFSSIPRASESWSIRRESAPAGSST